MTSPRETTPIDLGALQRELESRRKRAAVAATRHATIGRSLETAQRDLREAQAAVAKAEGEIENAYRAIR